jgi:uncharacterized protein YcfL
MDTRIAPLFAALLLGAACSSTRGRPENTYVGAEGAAKMEMLEGNPGLDRDLEILNPRSERRQGRLYVEFDLRNKRASNLPLEWSVEWFDTAGFEVEAARSWTPIVIGAKGFESLSMLAPTPAATSWRLHVRPPNPVE